MARKKQRVVKYDMGVEPTKVETQSELIRAYQWYNYEYTVKQGRKFVVDWLKKNRSRSVTKFNALPDSRVQPTLCWQAKMATNGVLPEDSMTNFIQRLDDHLDYKAPKVVKAKSAIVKPTVQDRIKEQVSSWIADIEDEIDLLGTKVQLNFNTYEFLTLVEAKSVHVNRIVSYYRPVYEEVSEALSGKDEQLNGAYSYLNKSALKRLVTFYENLLSDCGRILNNSKVVRKPRARKAKSVDQITKNVNFLTESKEYKIVSTPPEKIVGAMQVWLFNVKYNTLSMYQALDGGLTIRGTTIQNFDPEKSVSKRVRKSEEALTSVTKSGKVALRKLMDQFKTKATEPAGRINKDTLIVRVV
jgi:hypothetical protein